MGITPPPQWAIEMMTAMKGGFAANSDRMDQFSQHLTNQDASLEKVVTAGIDTNVRLDRVETQTKRNELRIETLEGRAGSTSMRIKTESDLNLDQQSKLADQVIKQNQLEEAIHETRAIAEGTATAIKKQSDLMGIGKAGFKWLGSSEGRAVCLQVGATAYAVYELLKHGGVIK